ncbi:hypothetical protein H6F78_03220 [Coleofasciculus sp. FACHB-64]|nr:hypothetical protein [Coleofasciculus sp. FACHB-64]MBD1839919.1 hypothetical protein [Coleofasciculus sp. FACHB-501]MBD2044651.1 hypothetical protein [Coleofasciculus sp. FACHB-64]
MPNLFSHVLLQSSAAAGRPRLYRMQQFFKSGRLEAIATKIAMPLV